MARSQSFDSQSISSYQSTKKLHFNPLIRQNFQNYTEQTNKECFFLYDPDQRKYFLHHLMDFSQVVESSGISSTLLDRMISNLNKIIQKSQVPHIPIKRNYFDSRVKNFQVLSVFLVAIFFSLSMADVYSLDQPILTNIGILFLIAGVVIQLVILLTNADFRCLGLEKIQVPEKVRSMIKEVLEDELIKMNFNLQKFGLVIELDLEQDILKLSQNSHKRGDVELNEDN